MRSLEVRADLRSGIHHLRQNLPFTIVAVPTLAIGISANSPNDPWTILAVASIFLVSSTAATWLPAHRASRIHPMNALRYE